MKNIGAVLIAVVLLAIMTGCHSPEPVTPTPTRLFPTQTLTISPTATPTLTIPAKPTLTPNPSKTPLPTATATITPMTEGAALPEAEVISMENIDQLGLVARWGNGQIRDIAFAPDGKTFVAASNNGFMVYDAHDFSVPPQWHAFNQPLPLQWIYFDETGSYLQYKLHLEYWGSPIAESINIIDYETGMLVDVEDSDLNWIKPTSQNENNELEFISTDGQWRFKGILNYECVSSFDDETGSPNPPIGGFIFRNNNTTPEYILDETLPCIPYKQIASPSGCDLFVFSYCGNAISPEGLYSAAGSFSTDNKTLTIMYQLTDYFSPQFSIIRTYETETGRQILQIGDLDNPVTDFAYSPDGNQLSVIYPNGTVELWDIYKQKKLFSSQDFLSPLQYVFYSFDGNSIIIQAENDVKIINAHTGDTISQFDGITSAVSPNKNIMAVAETSGTIRLRSISDGKILQTLRAHTGIVYNLSFSQDGEMLVSAGEDCKLLLWNTETGSYLHRLQPVWVNAFGEENTNSRIFLYYVDFIPGTNQLIGYGSWGTVASWDVETGDVLYTINPGALEYYQGMQTLNPHFPEDFDISYVDNTFTIGGNYYDLITGEPTGRTTEDETISMDCYLTDYLTNDHTLRFGYGYETLEGQLCAFDRQQNSTFAILPLTSNSKYNGESVVWYLFSPAGDQLLGITSGGNLNIYQIVP